MALLGIRAAESLGWREAAVPLRDRILVAKGKHQPGWENLQAGAAQVGWKFGSIVMIPSHSGILSLQKKNPKTNPLKHTAIDCSLPFKAWLIYQIQWGHVILAGVTAAVKFLCTSCTETLLLLYSIIWSKCFSLRHNFVFQFRWFIGTLTNIKESTYSEIKHFLLRKRHYFRGVLTETSKDWRKENCQLVLKLNFSSPLTPSFFLEVLLLTERSCRGDRLTIFLYCGSPFEGWLQHHSAYPEGGFLISQKEKENNHIFDKFKQKRTQL